MSILFGTVCQKFCLEQWSSEVIIVAAGCHAQAMRECIVCGSDRQVPVGAWACLVILSYEFSNLDFEVWIADF